MSEARPINERFSEKAGMIEVASDDLYLKNPRAILETFLLYQTATGVKGLSARTLRALYNARKVMDASFRNDPENHQTFRAMLMQPRGITHALRLMNQTSVLGRYLWVFRRIVGQMQHDLFHVYTVDQHILMVLRNVRRFFIPEHAHEYPKCTALAASFDKHWLLYVAALFHDVAKGRGGDHSELGGSEVRRFCKRSIDDLIDSREQQVIAGIVSDLRVINGQRGRLAIFKLDDKSGMPKVVQGYLVRKPDGSVFTGMQPTMIAPPIIPVTMLRVRTILIDGELVM